MNKKEDEAWRRSRAPKSIRIQLEPKGVSGVEGKGQVLLQLQTGGGFVGGVTGGDNNTDTLNTHTHWHSYGDAWSD